MIGIIANGENEADKRDLLHHITGCNMVYVLRTAWDQREYLRRALPATHADIVIVDVHREPALRYPEPTEYPRIRIVDLRYEVLRRIEGSYRYRGFRAWTSSLTYIYADIVLRRVSSPVRVWYNPASREEYRRAWNGEMFWKGALHEIGCRLIAGPGSQLYGEQQLYPWTPERTLMDTLTYEPAKEI